MLLHLLSSSTSNLPAYVNRIYLHIFLASVHRLCVKIAGLKSAFCSLLNLGALRPMATASSIPCTSRPSLSLPRPFALANNPQLSSLPSRFRQLTVLPKIGVRVRSSTPRLRVLCLQEPKAAIIKGNSWDKLVLNSDIPVLVEFYASWCGPCRMVQRVVDELATEYSGRLKCFIIHTDNDLAVAEDYDIKVVPVVLLFKNGERREAIAGTMPKEFYVAAIERLLQS